MRIARSRLGQPAWSGRRSGCLSTGQASSFLYRFAQPPVKPFSSDTLSGTSRVSHVSVPCASSGHITLSLYNVADHPPTTPLLIYLPPAPCQADSEELLPPPSFLQDHPVVTIRYRWEKGSLWPTPIHDVLFGYDWIKTHLAPPLPASTLSAKARRHHMRRNIYIYGSRLGGGLGAALALTETRRLQLVTVRGLAAHNGVYNWMAFVDENSGKLHAGSVLGLPPLSSLFARPADLSDPFASPSLFFRTTGYLVPPPDFDSGFAELAATAATMTTPTAEGAVVTTTTYSVIPSLASKAYLGFPPRHSALALPKALLLHESPPPDPAEAPKARQHGPNPATVPPSGQRKQLEATSENNSYATQAQELADLMQRSRDVGIRRLRRESDRDDLPDVEADQKVRAVDVGGSQDELNSHGQKVLLDWLDKQTRRYEMH